MGIALSERCIEIIDEEAKADENPDRPKAARQ
jgi:hypothetical protein